ncbi:MAG TPA: type II secretion system minor pseudopilin GspJ, partial [Pseudomonadales bacterium]|nr:type II secretion system minor pseudopilin GspJ [Pseudomonadales bacterium]
ERPVRARGFTLLELMIAMAIFAFIAVGAYYMLNTFITAKDRTDVHSVRLAKLQRAMLIIQRDFEQVAPRPVRDEADELLPALFGMPNGAVEFTRNGWTNPTGAPRSDLQRVRYEFEQGKLWRTTWQVLDRAPDSKPQRVAILDDVAELAIKYYPLQVPLNGAPGSVPVIGEPVEAWPQATADEASTLNRADLPKLVDFALTLNDFGEIHRQFVLADNDPKAKDPAANSFTPTGTTPGVRNPGGEPNPDPNISGVEGEP